jgi:hypothetical protein
MLDVCRWGDRRRGFDSFQDCAGSLALQTGPVLVAGRGMGFGEADPCQRPGAFFEGFYAALDTIRHEGVVLNHCRKAKPGSGGL